MVFTKYEKTKYIFIFLSLFICLYFSCTVTLVPDCAVFFVILNEIISFLWNRLIHPIFRVSNLFRSFLPSIIFGDLSLKNKSVTWHNFLPPYVEFSGMKSNSYFRVICWYLRDAPWRKTKRSCHNSGSNWEIDTDCPCTRIFSKRNFY